MRTILFFLLISGNILAQDAASYQQLFDNYEKFKEESITSRRFKHTDIQSIIKNISENDLFKISKVGKSIEGRDINLISIGKGKTSVLLWSQMHGNEPTATMALMDIFNFFNSQDEFPDFKKLLLEELTIHFIPMLNPDGAERFERRNALDIDLNRDALRLQCPESQVLKHIRDSLHADWGFNLHDQNPYYGVGLTDKTASVSFLAPAYNYEKEINEVRGNAMKLIAEMNDILQHYIPEKIGRYSDDFEPRAFGDNIQKWGTSTILIESGGLKGDPEKQLLRKLHFVILLSAFEAIATGDFNKKEIAEYEKIPFNESNGFNDLIIRKATVFKNGKSFMVDIAFRNTEMDYDGHRLFYTESNVKDIGDLRTVFGYEEWNAKGYQAIPGKVYTKTFRKMKQLKKLNILDLLQQGYTDFRVKKPPPQQELFDLPIHVFSSESVPSNNVAIGQNPCLVFKKDGKVEFVLINGFLFDLEKDAEKIKNAFEKF